MVARGTKDADIPVVPLPSTLPGNQIVSEGIISDVLNEHFGEAVELVGVVLLRNGPLTFSEVWRICNANFLAFPRDMLNAFNMYQSSSSGCEQVPPRVVRDALLVLIHHGLVCFDSGIYRLEPREILARMNFPFYLNLITNETEKHAMELVFRKGRISRTDLVKMGGGEAVLKNLMAKRFLMTVDSVVQKTSPRKSTSPKKDRIVLTFNSREFELTFLKRIVIDHLRSCMVGDMAVEIVEELFGVCSSTKSKGDLAESLSIGDISVTELHSKLSGISKNDLVGVLIQLQSLGYVGKKHQIPDTSAASTSSKRRRTANNMQMLSDDFEPLTTSASTPSYMVRMFTILDEIQDKIIHELVLAVYGIDGARVFELLLSSNQKMESVHVADVCAISREESLRILHRLQNDGLCCAQEVPKIVSTGGASSASGVSAMMRSVASAIWLYYVDKPRARKCLISMMFQTIINLRRRFRLEVSRQCKIEDRATVLTEPEEAYLQKVHEAQDILELNAIKLVPSLLVLLMGNSD